MRAFGRLAGSFILMIAVGYAAVVMIFPPAPAVTVSDDVTTGRSAAVRLSQEASALIGAKPSDSLD